MKIEVNCDVDTLTITKGKEEVRFERLREPITIYKILTELLNLMETEGGILLEMIDEGQRVRSEEW